MTSSLFSGIPCVPLVRRRYRLWIHFTADGETLSGLWQEGKARILRLSSSSVYSVHEWYLSWFMVMSVKKEGAKPPHFLPGLHCRRRAVQLDPNHAHNLGTFRLLIHGRQRGHL
ncbi:hypothetical protein ANCCAN_14713 [Ancylostoma caninum]|uniref:Uncharacterized protein n=1 Tax=Ancylostoma caninum TaxID=29170 RepID=A0A368G4K4_ANCCA|nr:hypothetical protein ANCCAN_14713 [Ancylostoma caninum]